MSKTNFYSKQVKQMPYSDVHVIEQLRHTNALLKFCRDHNRPESDYISSIENCSKALARKDIRSAVNYYLEVPLGGMGCFNDWFPPSVFEHETDDYSWSVFEALTSNWSRFMQLSVEK